MTNAMNSKFPKSIGKFLNVLEIAFYPYLIPPPLFQATSCDFSATNITLKKIFIVNTALKEKFSSFTPLVILNIMLQHAVTL